MKQPVTLAALAAMVWVVIRAAHQAITIDEATTFVAFVQHPDPFQWIAGTNNHLLNTLGMRLATTLFGVSEFTARLPAVLGAALYLAVTHRLCRLLTDSSRLQLLAFLLLAANPFILDHLVAARGYGMALAFLMLAIVAILVWQRDPHRHPLIAVWALASAALGLCFTANFSFAFAATATFLALLYETRKHLSRRVLAAAILPGAAIVLLLPAQILLDWPSGELWYGSTSLVETASTVIDATLYRINPELVNPTVVRLFTNLKLAVLPLAALTALLYLAWLWRSRTRHPNLHLAALFTAIATATVLFHVIAYYGFGLLLPRDRTALFFVPLLTGAVAAIAAVPALAPRGRTLRIAAIGAQVLLAAYFLVCLRLDSFKEWYWDAESDRLYSVLSCMHDHDHLDRVAAGWPFVGTLNFYRAAGGFHSFAEVHDQDTAAPGMEAYAIDPLLVPGVVEAKHLTVIYRAPTTNALIAVPPEQVHLAASVCLQFPHLRTSK